MFKKFVLKEDVTGRNALKSSVQRGVRSRLSELYPAVIVREGGETEEADDVSDEDDDNETGPNTILDAILPKKQTLMQIKCREHLSIFALNQVPLFVSHYDGPLIPTLRLVHQFPNMLVQVRVDDGAVKHVLSGADVMCPGLTSRPALQQMPDDLKQDTIVAIMGEGFVHAMAVGIMKMSAAEVRRVNKGIAIEVLHYLNDPLWKIKSIA